MIKKLFSFVCCLAPMGAMAVPQDLTPANAEGTIELAGGLTINSGDDTQVIKNGGTAENPFVAKNLVLGSNGLTVANLSVGQVNETDTGYLQIAPGTAAGSGGFEIASDGTVSIATLLEVLNGQTLTIAGHDNTRIDFNIGDGSVNSGIQNAGTLNLANIDGFQSGSAIRSTGAKLSIDANTIEGTSLENAGGDVSLVAHSADTLKNTFIMRDGIKNTAGTGKTTISAQSMTAGDIQNNSGVMDIILAGNLTGSGVIENKGGTSMKIQAADIDVTGAMTNESGKMEIISTGNLTVQGKNGDYASNASFVNGGNLYVDVAGKTTLDNGFDISAMGVDNTFELATGTLDVGNDENWLHLFSNKLNKFVVNVRGGDLDLATDIINGVGDGRGTANMTLSALNITANSVQNDGATLNMALPVKDSDELNPITGNITITNGITGNSGTTNILAGGTLSAGAVQNEGQSQMHLSGEKGVTLASVLNGGKSLKIQSSNAAPGNINIAGTVTNEAGTLDIQARQITIGNTLDVKGGYVNISGSDTNGDSLQLADVNVTNGVFSIDALKGGVSIDGDLTVKGTGVGGAMNVGASTTAIHVTGDTLIAGDVTLSADDVVSGNNMNLGGRGVQDITFTTDGTFRANGIEAVQNDASRTAHFIASDITIGNDGIAAAGLGNLVFGNTATKPNVTTTGEIAANKIGNNIGSIEFYGNQITAGSVSGDGKITTHGTVLGATNGDINIADGVWFGASNGSGLVVMDTDGFTLTTAAEGAAGRDIMLGSVNMTSAKTLDIVSARDVSIDGQVDGKGTLNINATAGMVKIGNTTTVAQTGALDIDAANIVMADLTSNADTKLKAAEDISLGAVSVNAGDLDVTAENLTGTLLTVSGGARANIDVVNTAISGPVQVTGDMVQGNSNGALNIAARATDFAGGALTVSGAFSANAGIVDYNFAGPVSIGGDITVDNGAGANLNASSISAGNVVNHGTLALVGQNGVAINNGRGTIDNFGDLTLSAGAGIVNVAGFTSVGTATLGGAGMTTGAAFDQNVLYQNYSGTLAGRDVNIASDNYTLTTSNVIVDAVKQYSGRLVMNTSDLEVAESINATGLRVVATPATNWLNVGVGGDVSGNTQFVGLEHMNVGGNYTFNDNSALVAAILPYDKKDTPSSIYNYWADVSLVDDNKLGQITNRDNAEPLISVGGKFITDLSLDMHNSDLANGVPAHTDQVGIKIFDMIDQGSAIWLLHAENGIEELATKIRNLNVQFCNADGSMCFDYYGSAEQFNGSDEDLPAYLSVRDTDGNGSADSVYIVFDPRFGGPLAMFKIQPIVGREPDHTKGEYAAAGALDNLIEGQLIKNKFTNKTPIDAIPVAFRGTNMEELANELYNRMNYYDMTRDGTGLARFSRLTQAREIEQMAGSVVMNEHTSFRDFEDHMMDEFIWNRNRNLRKAWGEFDFTLFNQKAEDNKRIDGNRFSFTGGYDWQESQTLILGLAGRVSHTSGENDDHMNLGYRPNEYIAGRVKTDVSDTNFGIGAYLMKTLGTKMRGYGNAFLDLHWLDVTRDQNYVGRIEGDGTAFSLISEWGLMHDWLNQYVVGNIYARVGYNTGFSVTEKVHGRDYMKLESDGYFILTPGYTLTAQKRIYPSAWFQIRPYASIGVEYDVFGAPDSAQYKFAPARHFTKYDVEIDPLWANIGGGMEFLSAAGVQVGLDYRYQYNADIQMHKIKISGSYRF